MTSDPTTALREAFTTEVAHIRSRRDLSDEGRQRQLAKAYVTARDKMRQLNDRDTDDTGARIAQLRRDLFGIRKPNDPAAVISARDADDRAEQCKKADEAMELLDRALGSGDEALARAVAARAANRSLVSIGNGWVAVLEQWADSQPKATHAALEELVGLLSPQGGTRRLARAMSLSIPKPLELKAVASVEALARSADRNDEDENLHPLFDNRRLRERLGKA